MMKDDEFIQRFCTPDNSYALRFWAITITVALFLSFGIWSALGDTVYPLWATAESPSPPQSIVVISCRVDDLTGRQDSNVKGWRDLEWHFTNGNELECKREEIPLTDAAALMAPEIRELHPDFSDFSQCSTVAMQYAPKYEKDHSGWGVMAIGCPVQITSNGPNGPIIGWHMPECPRTVGGLAIVCRFDPSQI